MNEKYLVINCGSSSLKFSLYGMPEEVVIAKGYIEKIGYDDSFWNISYNDKTISGAAYLKGHNEAVNVMTDELVKNKIIGSMDEIKGIGHRVLHGGEIYNKSVLILRSWRIPVSSFKLELKLDLISDIISLYLSKPFGNIGKNK